MKTASDSLTSETLLIFQDTLTTGAGAILALMVGIPVILITLKLLSCLQGK